MTLPTYVFEVTSGVLRCQEGEVDVCPSQVFEEVVQDPNTMNVVVVFFYNFFRRVKYKSEIPGSELALYKDSSQERVGIVVTGVFAAASSSSWAVVSSAENDMVTKCGLAMKDKLYIVHRR